MDQTRRNTETLESSSELGSARRILLLLSFPELRYDFMVCPIDVPAELFSHTSMRATNRRADVPRRLHSLVLEAGRARVC